MNDQHFPPLAVIGAIVVIFGLGFATAHYIAPEKIVTKTEYQDRIVTQIVEKTVENKNIKTTETKYPNGIDQIITENLSTVTTGKTESQAEKVSEKSESEVIKGAPSVLIQGIARYEQSQLGYEFQISKRFFGPIFLGAGWHPPYQGNNAFTASVGVEL